MFSYYGSKSKLVNLYEPPTYSVIREPFAGSARYSKKYWDRQIELFDINPTIINIWHYLQQATSKDIISLPVINIDFDLNKHLYLSQPEKDLIGFLIADGVAKPAKKLTRKWFSQRPNKINHRINGLMDLLPKIKHWKIELKDFRKIENVKCTWFIDPPYFQGGIAYPFNAKNGNWNYAELASWCKSRFGQVIVCENSNANWLPFQPLARIKGANKISIECVYYINSEHEQLELFNLEEK